MPLQFPTRYEKRIFEPYGKKYKRQNMVAAVQEELKKIEKAMDNLLASDAPDSFKTGLQLTLKGKFKRNGNWGTGTMAALMDRARSEGDRDSLLSIENTLREMGGFLRQDVTRSPPNLLQHFKDAWKAFQELCKLIYTFFVRIANLGLELNGKETEIVAAAELFIDEVMFLDPKDRIKQLLI